MPFSGFTTRSIDFLNELSCNNQPGWLDAHRAELDAALLDPAKALIAALKPRLRELDPKLQAVPRVGGSIHAFERRSRYPRGQPLPYREQLDLWFWSGQRRMWDNSGLFLRLTAKDLVLSTGMIELQKDRLARYREHVLDDARGAELERIVYDLRASGYVVAGEGYKRVPPGVPADHERAALLKHRGVFAVYNVAHPPELFTERFDEYALEHFARMAPLHQWLLGLWR
jgi:uncharacterized protein (TIGR02453 family)